ncbi:hypothetical protein HEK616_76450 (plasmid) [Streptomyces nigrescens]|uniref:Uncharacterized protein n=1 Tax=Streptomyces nigrescens TaxID=1920 RepID=A0ABM8A6D0_STRNI|nr:hypothetical protein HEK616_76450 [Streptomyces nigrescens]
MAGSGLDLFDRDPIEVVDDFQMREGVQTGQRIRAELRLVQADNGADPAPVIVNDGVPSPDYPPYGPRYHLGECAVLKHVLRLS